MNYEIIYRRCSSMDLQEGSGLETSEQSLQKLQSETDIQAATGDDHY